MANVPTTSVTQPLLSPLAPRAHVLYVGGFGSASLAVVLASAALLGWWYGSTPLLVIIAVLTPITLPLAYRMLVLLRRGRTDAAMLLGALILWIGALATTLFGWRIYSWTQMLAISPIVGTLPFLSRRFLAPVLLTSGLVLTLAAILSVPEPLLEPGIPEPVFRSLVAFYSMLFVILLSLSTWNATNWIWELLDEAAARTKALEASERSLEAKVVERTAELSVARDEALAASRAKSSFLANMSHELRTPLTAIIGYGELLHEGAERQGSERLAADLGHILTAGHQLLGLVDEVLDLSRIEAGRIGVALERFEIEPLVAEAAATVKPLLDRNGNRLELALAPALGSMRSDPTKLRQILVNLLGNAAKFTSGGTVRLAVQRVDEGGAPWVELRVADTGIGMTREQLGRVFETFTQADPSIFAKYGGTGLGLTIVRRFCELLGGEVTAQSEPGRGSEFRVRLPAELPEPRAGAEPGEAGT